MPPTSDVSDEALACMVREWYAGRHYDAFELAKRIRDLTATRCVDEIAGLNRSPEWDEHNEALEQTAATILALFPGAKP